MFKRISFDYSDTTVLITGGSNGIGHACAKAYQDAGATVIITGRQKSASDYDNDLQGLQYHQLELDSTGNIDSLFSSLSSLDILINNAGGTQKDEWSIEGFNKSLDVNLNSSFAMATHCKELLMQSKLEGGASIIGIASMTSFFGSEWTPGYGPAKTGVVGLARMLGHSWGKDGLRCNAIAAGLTKSNLTSYVIENMPEIVESSLQRQGIKRLGEGDDIASMVLYLTSPAASWVTGQTIAVDGGFSTGL